MQFSLVQCSTVQYSTVQTFNKVEIKEVKENTDNSKIFILMAVAPHRQYKVVEFLSDCVISLGECINQWRVYSHGHGDNS